MIAQCSLDRVNGVLHSWQWLNFCV